MLDVIVVGYNTVVSECAAVAASLASNSVGRTIFVDNSTDASILAENESSRGEGLLYIGMGRNAGLSVAYNRAVRETMSRFVVLFDDDTHVSSSYFDLVASWVRRVDADVLLPVVMAGGAPLSPCKVAGPLFLHLRTAPRMLPERFSAINTGMAVRRDVLCDHPYDEELFLDFVDHSFVRSLRASGSRFVLMPDVVIEQQFSGRVDDVNSAKSRLRIFAVDADRYYQSPAGRVVRLGRIAARHIKIGARSIWQSVSLSR